MTTVLPQGKQQYFDLNGDPLVGGKLYTYQPGPGNTTPKATTSSYGGANNTNPIILDARGECVAFWDGGYNVRLESASGGLIWTVESINADPSAATLDAELRADLASTVAGKGNTLVSFTITSAEQAAGVSIVNAYYPPGHVYRYGTNTTPGTTDMTTALQASINQAKQTNGDDAYWPADTYLLSTITASGSGYNIRTAGGRKTVLKQKTGTSSTTGQILIVTGSNINVGDLAFIGNIATDTGEFHHGVYCFDDSHTLTIQNLTFGSLYGTNIRGDVFYAGGYAARPLTGVRVLGTVSGTNIYRNLVSIVGGEVTIDAIINDGPVGYRDFDVEPNAADAGGTYQAGSLRVRYAKVGCTQITSGDPTVMNTYVRVDEFDCDFSRIAASTPGYPSAPGVNGQAMLLGFCKLLSVGYWKIRGYNYNPIFGKDLTGITWSQKSNAVVETMDVATSAATETTYNAIVADQGTGSIATFEIGTLLCTLTATTKMVFNGNGMKARVRRGTVSGGLLATNMPDSEFENIALDMNSASGNMLENCTNCIINNLTVTNAASATMLRGSTGNVFVGVTGTFSTVEGPGCSENRVIRGTLNGVKYAYDFLGVGYVLAKAMADANQTLTALESTSMLIRTSGALTAQRNLVVSTVPRMYSIDNSCTGFGVQVIGATGTGIVIGAGKKAIVQHDGTNVVRVTADI